MRRIRNMVYSKLYELHAPRWLATVLRYWAVRHVLREINQQCNHRVLVFSWWRRLDNEAQAQALNIYGGFRNPNWAMRLMQWSWRTRRRMLGNWLVAYEEYLLDTYYG